MDRSWFGGPAAKEGKAFLRAVAQDPSSAGLGQFGRTARWTLSAKPGAADVFRAPVQAIARRLSDRPGAVSPQCARSGSS